MNLKCYELQGFDMWLGNPIKAYFKTIKDAENYHKVYCIGSGIISKVRLEAEGKFYTSIQPVNAKVTYLSNND